MRYIAFLILLTLLGSAVVGAQVTDEDRAQLVAGNNTFAFDLYQTLRTENDGNLIFSPYSISQAFAMTYAGARGNTEAQMNTVFAFQLPQDTLHPTFGALTSDFNEQLESDSEKTDFQLNIVNALWGQNDFAFNPDYLALVDTNYGAGLELLDFRNQPEESRQTINQWVADQTEDKILDLLPPDSINPDTRLVLTNAVYFKASWLSTFDEEYTEDADFFLLDGTTVTVPLMVQTDTFYYTEGNNYQAVSLPYFSDSIEMLIILPAEGEFEAVEASLDDMLYNEIRASLQYQTVQLYLPRFEAEFSTSLRDALESMGLTDAFNDDLADFSGMLPADSEIELVISDALHKAFIKVDEDGTEAAAATAVIIAEATAAEPQEPVIFRADRPFIYAIHDRETGSILFLGRVMNPQG